MKLFWTAEASRTIFLQENYPFYLMFTVHFSLSFVTPFDMQLLYWSEVPSKAELVVFSTMLAFQHLHCWTGGEYTLHPVHSTLLDKPIS